MPGRGIVGLVGGHSPVSGSTIELQLLDGLLLMEIPSAEGSGNDGEDGFAGGCPLRGHERLDAGNHRKQVADDGDNGICAGESRGLGGTASVGREGKEHEDEAEDHEESHCEVLDVVMPDFG